MPRVPYLSREDLPQDKRHIYDGIARTRRTPGTDDGVSRSFQALLHSPDAAEAVAGLGEYLRFNTPLDAVARHIAILSTAKQLESRYLWAYYEPVARDVGVREEVIESIRTGRAPMGLPAKEGVFAQAANELVNRHTMTERTFQAVEHLIGAGQTVDLILLVGYYVMIGASQSALGVEPPESRRPAKELDD